MKKLFLFLIIILGLGVFVFFNFFKRNKFVLLNNLVDNKVTVNNFFIYGNHLNMSGNFNIDSYDTVKIVLKSLDNELSYDLNINGNNFSTSNYINDGIYLDNIIPDEYFVFLKVDDKYYNLTNDTDYGDVEYYTITNNNKNNLINIRYSSYSNKKFFEMTVKETELPVDYYDIVIDAGHGGDDPGAGFASHNEADITLDYALSLKESLENTGLKVKLTRDSDVTLDSYGPNSRTGMVYESRAKYVFSIHLNSSEERLKSGGVEIYSPSNSNLDFASSLASNIVNSANTNYSHNESFKIKDGVYVRTFTKSDIIDSIDSAKENGYNPYSINEDTTYYFMIRETGGIATNAYVDGRNKDYNKNDYFDSNIGAEGYLMELGFINYWGDLNNLIDNKDGYIDGLTKAITEEIKQEN